MGMGSLFGLPRGISCRASRPRARAGGSLGLAVALLALLSACGGAQPATDAASVVPSAAAPGVKRITVAMLGNSPSFYNDMVRGVPGSDGLQDLVHMGMAVMSDQGTLLPVLAGTLPTLDNGQWVLQPDGRIDTTWTINPNARWQDGAPFTADDLVFSVQVAKDSELPLLSVPPLTFLDSVEAPDSHTLVAHWNQPFIWADELFTTAYSPGMAMPLPKHLLGTPYEENKGGFLGLPYWTGEFVGTGPFKLREFVAGDHILLDADDQFVLGRPKLDSIEVKIITESTTIVVNMLSDVLDLTLGRTVSVEQALDAQRRGPIKVEATPFNLQRIYPQFIDPQPAVIADVQFRQAALLAIDRQALIDALEGGLTVVPSSILPPNDTRSRAAEAGLTPYPFDPQRALAMIEQLGYGKAADGTLQSAAGDPLLVPIQATADEDNTRKLLYTIAADWQNLGMIPQPTPIDPAQNQDRQAKATRPGFQLSGGPNGLDALATLVSSEVPRAETRYSGVNTARYASPEYDALYRGFLTTLPEPARTEALARILVHINTNLPIIPLYYRVEARLTSARLTGVAPRTLESTPAWNAYQWDIQ